MVRSDMAKSMLVTPSTASNPSLGAYTLMPEANSSYFSHTKDVYHTKDPLGDATMGLMMMLSTLRYQSAYLPSPYSTAASQAGKAAFRQSGGQASQDRFETLLGNKAKETAHSLGLTDGEM